VTGCPADGLRRPPRRGSLPGWLPPPPRQSPAVREWSGRALGGGATGGVGTSGGVQDRWSQQSWLPGRRRRLPTGSACRTRPCNTTWHTPGARWGRRPLRSSFGSWHRGCRSWVTPRRPRCAHWSDRCPQDWAIPRAKVLTAVSMRAPSTARSVMLAVTARPNSIANSSTATSPGSSSGRTLPKRCSSRR
jgi:hypothetical protein